MERNCLRDKFWWFLWIFVKFHQLNLPEKSTGSQFTKLDPHNFFVCLFFRITKIYIFSWGSLSIKDGPAKNILQNIKQYKKIQPRKKNVNLFIISAPFDFLLRNQSRIKSFISIIWTFSIICYLKYRKI